jgi:hypothetical protein
VFLYGSHSERVVTLMRNVWNATLKSNRGARS